MQIWYAFNIIKSFYVISISQKRNVTQKNNLLKLKNFVLVKFLQDEMVDPRDSEVSGWKGRGGGVALLPRIIQNFDTIYM